MIHFFYLWHFNFRAVSAAPTVQLVPLALTASTSPGLPPRPTAAWHPPPTFVAGAWGWSLWMPQLQGPQRPARPYAVSFDSADC